jgi:hypothetical protein
MKPDMSIFTAYHEAGHFVTRHHLTPEEDPGPVSIIPDAGVDGFHSAVVPQALDVVPDFITVLYAGAAAELRFDPSRDAEVRSGSRTDDMAAATLLRGGFEGLGPGLGEHREEELRERARALVAEHWREIQALATELMKVHWLDGVEAGLICDAASGDQMAAARLAQRWAALVPVPEAAAKLGVSVANLRRRIKAGEVPVRRIGRSVRVNIALLRPLDREEADEVARLAREARGAAIRRKVPR